MVYLSRIYTRNGDGGVTALADGARVSKDDPRVEAMGAVDELNATIGLLLANAPEFEHISLVQDVSNDLFDVGADLCVPLDESSPSPDPSPLRVSTSQVKRLEDSIDRINKRLSPLTSFVLPGGSLASAWAHMARASCRRAERRVVTLNSRQTINPVLLQYLNRLSDFLFVLARAFNGNGADDVLWDPGRTQER